MSEKTNILLDSILKACGRPSTPRGIFRGRKFTQDAAFTFRMGAGFAGDVNRSHPMTIEPTLNDVTNPVLAYGLALLAVGAAPNSVRNLVAATDGAITAIYGISVRPFPTQQPTATNFGAQAFGSGTPPVQGSLDVLKGGYILVNVNGVAHPVKGGQVYVYVAASAGSHVLGGFEAGAGANLVSLDATATRIYWNGPDDASAVGAGGLGVAELVFNP